MKRLLFTLSLAWSCLSLTALAANDLDALAGKWTVKKTNDQGEAFTQTIEIKQDKFVFEIIALGGNLFLHAEGDLKLDRLPPFSVAHFVHIRAGSSASDLQDVDDEYTSIYSLDGDAWTMAANFDKQRPQKPTLDVYQRAKSASTRTLVIDEIEMSSTPQSGPWFLCFDASSLDQTKRFHVDGKSYQKNQIRIPVALELTKIQPAQKCTFRLQIDDDDADVCGDEVDNRTTGEFIIGEKGSQTYKPEEDWSYTIRWHLKPL